MEMEMNGYTLVMTCGAWPEQYDVYKDGKYVAYLRLRHGRFTVDAPNIGNTIYRAFPEGDGYFTDEERDFYLNEAVEAIQRYYQNVLV